MLPDGTTGAKRRGRQEVSNVPPRAVLLSGLHFVCCLLSCFPRSGLPPPIWSFRLVCFASFSLIIAVFPTDIALHRGGCCRSWFRLVWLVPKGICCGLLFLGASSCFLAFPTLAPPSDCGRTLDGRFLLSARVHVLDVHFLWVPKVLKSGVPTAFRYVYRCLLRSDLICSARLLLPSSSMANEVPNFLRPSRAASGGLIVELSGRGNVGGAAVCRWWFKFASSFRCKKQKQIWAVEAPKNLLFALSEISAIF